MKYRVDMTQTVTEGTHVIIEANSQEEAEEKAIQLFYNDPEGLLDWSFVEVQDEAEIIGCEEWPPLRDEPPEETNTVLDVTD